MHIKLGKIATIIPGYTFRGAIEQDSNGKISVFQARDLLQGVPVTNIEKLTKISFDIPEYKGHLQKNDILLVARGMKTGAFRSTVYLIESANVIPSSSIHVIRINDPKILPEYVSHYLNTKRGQTALAQIVSGSYIGALPRKKLEENILIPVPPLSTQKILADLIKNIRDQQVITQQMNKIKQSIINEAFTNLTTK